MLVPIPKFQKDQIQDRPIDLCILGSTGSIGCSALEVVRSHSDIISIKALTAGKNVERLYHQIQEFTPEIVAVATPAARRELKERFAGPDYRPKEILVGEEEIAALAAENSSNVVLAAIVGFAGLRSVLAAVEAGKKIALANKESLVCAGELVKDKVAASGAEIIPVDSEHSAIFQAMQGNTSKEIKDITLTASGGPFFRTPVEQLSSVKPEQALKHPNWSMGNKISIDSATMVNKALEVIEAHWLFSVAVNRINVLVHPQSIVHSLIGFYDGTQLAQLSVPDMKGPIAYALSYPGRRLSSVMETLNLAEVSSLEFFPLDNEKFPAVSLARQTLNSGGALPAVFNIANELAVEAFLAERIGFTQIVAFVSEALSSFEGLTYTNFADLCEINGEIRADLESRIN